ncbi:MAG: hypothetical protein JW953_11250 [Anaerolineae bacterium]|nr:hypothetical protein [Anaerolineae bacterium]
MPVKKLLLQLWLILILLLFAVLITACTDSQAETTPSAGVRTWLLVKEPEHPLPLDRKPVAVRSRTEAGVGVSHVELYALQLPSGETNLLIRADQAPFAQTSFTVNQTFIPTQSGHYVIQVKGYNRLGESAESDIISFDVE